MGLLAGYVGAQTFIAARPSPEAFGRLALLRGLCATGHIAALPVVSRSRRPLVAALLGMNVTASVVGWRGSVAMTADRPRT